MASISEFNIPATPSIRAWVSHQFQAFQAARAKRAMYRTTLNELNALSNRELADLGISRSGIRAIALQAFETV